MTRGKGSNGAYMPQVRNGLAPYQESDVEKSARRALCARATPIERASGDVHDKCTRNHQRKRLRELVQDVEQHRQENGPWKYKLSHLYYAPEVTMAVERIAAEQQLKTAA